MLHQLRDIISSVGKVISDCRGSKIMKMILLLLVVETTVLSIKFGARMEPATVVIFLNGDVSRTLART